MTQPLQECELNLEGVATTNFHAFPFGNDTRTADERALTKIIQHEMCHPTANPGGHHQIRGQTTSTTRHRCLPHSHNQMYI